MKKDLCIWYQGLGYEEGFGPKEVLSFHQKKMRIDTYAIISASDHFERQKFFGEDWDLGRHFFKCYSCLAISME